MTSMTSIKSKLGKLTLEEALFCTKCGAETDVVSECDDWVCRAPSGSLFIIKCALSCGQKSWCYCKPCGKKFVKSHLPPHLNTKIHAEAVAESKPPASTESIASPTTTKDASFADVCGPFAGIFDEPEPETIEPLPLKSVTETQEMQELPTEQSHRGDSLPLKINNQWLANLLKEQPHATKFDLDAIFRPPEVNNMKTFWVAELGSGRQRCGGGAIYLAARAFQQAKDKQLNHDLYPDFPEAMWQLKYMINHQLSTDRQRRLVWDFTNDLVQQIPRGVFFKRTWLPPENQLGKYYGQSGQNSMIRAMPCPKVQDIGGVAYVSIKAIATFALSNGIRIDAITIHKPPNPSNQGWHPEKRVEDIHQCKVACDWYQKILNDYYGQGNMEEKVPFVVGIPLTLFKDGFGAGKCKTNRNPTDLVHMTFGTPRDITNSTENTFAVAFGLKKASGWTKIEKIIAQEIKELSDCSNPRIFYDGCLQKVYPGVVKKFVEITDRAQKGDSTGTAAYGGDTHRCYGVSGKITTSSCKVKELEKFLEKQESGTTNANWGWSEAYVDRSEGNNGALFPACNDCRRRGLEKMGMTFPGMEAIHRNHKCTKCTNWCLRDNPSLDFPMHKDYPTFVAEGSPVPAPKGRDQFGTDTKLPFVELTWEFMMQACKFTFFQATRPKKSWTKTATQCYLKHCGVAADLSAQLFELASSCKRLRKQEEIKYNSNNGIHGFSTTDQNGAAIDHDFEWPAPWMDKEMLLSGFIEAIMHQLFLGVEKSNFELTGKWMTSTPKGSKISEAGFLRVVQQLILDLRIFSLSWLPAFPLTGKDGKLGVGSWVAENWITMVRLSPILYLWCSRDGESVGKYGAQDVMRLVTSYHAFVARCLTHGAVNEAYVEDAELYMKEFLSATHELDIRVRYKQLNKKKTSTDSNSKSKKKKKPNSKSKKKPKKNTNDQEQKASDSSSKDGSKSGSSENQAESSPGNHKKGEAWWLKSNYMSLCNLLSMMLVLGPLVLWWDGGGKGEKFIQAIKPLLKRGIRDDFTSFFVKILQKHYQQRQTQLLELCFGMQSSCNEWESVQETIVEMLNTVAKCLLPTELQTNSDSECNDDEDGYTTVEDTSESSDNNDGSSTHDGSRTVESDDNSSDSEDETEEEAESKTQHNDSIFSANEINGMTKARTFHIYRDEIRARKDLEDNWKPIAGVIQVSTGSNGLPTFEFFVVSRKPVKQFTMTQLHFEDDKGVEHGGIWYAPVAFSHPDKSITTSDFSVVQDKAQMSAVAIPLWYVLGKDHPDGNKYCVLTNWWKTRSSSGWFSHPTLDPNLYGASMMPEFPVEATMEATTDDEDMADHASL